MDKEFYKQLIDAKINLIAEEENKSIEETVKRNALMLLSGSAYIFDNKDIDYYMRNAIIMAYEFEKNWRKEWERLLEEEEKKEVCQ